MKNYKYLIYLNIIVVFNKLRLNSNSKDLVVFIITLEAYKYRVLFFELTNDSNSF